MLKAESHPPRVHKTHLFRNDSEKTGVDLQAGD